METGSIYFFIEEIKRILGNMNVQHQAFLRKFEEHFPRIIQQSEENLDIYEPWFQD